MRFLYLHFSNSRSIFSTLFNSLYGVFLFVGGVLVVPVLCVCVFSMISLISGSSLAISALCIRIAFLSAQFGASGVVCIISNIYGVGHASSSIAIVSVRSGRSGRSVGLRYENFRGEVRKRRREGRVRITKNWRRSDIFLIERWGGGRSAERGGRECKKSGEDKKRRRTGRDWSEKTTKPNESESQIGSCLQYHIREALDSNILGL